MGQLPMRSRRRGRTASCLGRNAHLGAGHAQKAETASPAPGSGRGDGRVPGWRSIRGARADGNSLAGRRRPVAYAWRTRRRLRRGGRIVPRVGKVARPSAKGPARRRSNPSTSGCATDQSRPEPTKVAILQASPPEEPVFMPTHRGSRRPGNSDDPRPRLAFAGKASQDDERHGTRAVGAGDGLPRAFGPAQARRLSVQPCRGPPDGGPRFFPARRACGRRRP
jgi:hypothetical protein